MKLNHKHYIQTLLPFFFSMCLVTPTFATPLSLSLDDSIALTLKNNHKIRISQNAQEESAWTVQRAQSLKSFNVTYSHTDMRTDQPPSYAPTLEPVPIYNYSANQLNLTLPLYSGRKLENMIDQAKLGQTVSTLNVKTVQQQLTLEATTGYFKILQAQNLLVIAKQTVDDFTTHLQDIQVKFDAGIIPLPDVLQTKVKLANAQDGLIKAQNNLDLAIYSLNNVMGLPLRGEIKLKDDFTYRPYSHSLDECIHLAFINRPDIHAADTNITIKEDSVKIAQSGNQPAINLFGNNTWDDTKFPGNKDSKWLVGVNVEMNVFDSGRTASQIKVVQSGVSTSQEQAKKIRDDISLEVSTAYLNMKEAIKRMDTNLVAVEQADTDLKLSKQRYDAGVGTNLDVMDAELALAQTKTNYMQALYDYNTDRAQLDKAMGITVQ